LQAAVQEVGGGVTHYPLPTVTVDSVQLGWVFQNLIGDVRRVHGGSLAASSCLGYAEGKAASFLSVEDNGIGMEPRCTERIFASFQLPHSHQEHSGTVIGLAICTMIEVGHGGVC
jgi:two-component system, chemotaxis family, sensor kinase Cph1